MTNYETGVRVERAVVRQLIRDGYDLTRGAGSKGTADIIAFKPGQILLVNVKLSRMPSPADRQRLVTVAAWLTPYAVPLVALGPPSAVSYRRLTGPGPHDWEPWTPDELATP